MAFESTSSAKAQGDVQEDHHSYLESIKASGILRDFVQKRQGRWDHDQWLELLDTLRDRGFFVNPDAIGLELERERVVYQSGSAAVRKAPMHAQTTDAAQHPTSPLDAELTERARDLAVREQAMAKWQEQLKQRITELASKEKELRSFEDLLREKDQLLQSKEQEIARMLQREQEISKKHALLIEREQELDSMQTVPPEAIAQLTARAERAESHITQLQAKLIEAKASLRQKAMTIQKREEELMLAIRDARSKEALAQQAIDRASKNDEQTLKAGLKEKLKLAESALTDARKRLKLAVAKEKELQRKEAALAKREHAVIEQEFHKLLSA